MSELSKHTRTRLITVDGKKVRAHRYLMEQLLGRKLLPAEHVHHINGNPLDNRVENLCVIESRAHMILHKQKHPTIKTCEYCGKEYSPNPHKRKRQKCCGSVCARLLATRNMTKTRYAHS